MRHVSDIEVVEMRDKRIARLSLPKQEIRDILRRYNEEEADVVLLHPVPSIPFLTDCDPGDEKPW